MYILQLYIRMYIRMYILLGILQLPNFHLEKFLEFFYYGFLFNVMDLEKY